MYFFKAAYWVCSNNLSLLFIYTIILHLGCVHINHYYPDLIGFSGHLFIYVLWSENKAIPLESRTPGLMCRNWMPAPVSRLGHYSRVCVVLFRVCRVIQTHHLHVTHIHTHTHTEAGRTATLQSSHLHFALKEHVHGNALAEQDVWPTGHVICLYCL